MFPSLNPTSPEGLLLYPKDDGDIIESLGNKVTFHIDYADPDSYVLKKGAITRHQINASTSDSTGTSFFSTPLHSVYDYRTIGTGLPSPTKPNFSVILNYVPYENMYANTAVVNEHILCSNRINMTNTTGGWALTAFKVGTAWYLGCWFAGLAANGTTQVGYQCRSNTRIDVTGVDAVSNVGMSWNPSDTANNRLKLYINGVRQSLTTITASEPVFASSTQWSAQVVSGPLIGWWYGHTSVQAQYFNAPLIAKGFTYWQSELTESQFTSYFNNGITLSESAILAMSPARHWGFDAVADGVATTGNNIHLDSVAGAGMPPRKGFNAGSWLPAVGGSTETSIAAKTVWTAEKLVNSASTGGYIGLQSGNALEYREAGLTVDAPTHGTRQLVLGKVTGQRRARLIDATLEDIFSHTDGVAIWCVQQDTFHGTEGFDKSLIIRETGHTTPGTPNSYMDLGNGVYLGTRRSNMIRTENAASVWGGAYLPTTMAAPSTSVPYMFTILKISGDYWFRRTNLLTDEVLEHTGIGGSNTLNGFWWPSTLENQGKSYEFLNMYGHAYQENLAKQYFGHDFIVRNISYNQTLALEKFVKANL